MIFLDAGNLLGRRHTIIIGMGSSRPDAPIPDKSYIPLQYIIAQTIHACVALILIPQVILKSSA